MSTTTHTDRRDTLVAGLRRTAFAAIVALLLEYGFGLFLFGTTPTPAHGAGLFVAFGIAISSGPATLIIHAVLGSAIVLGGIMSLIRAVQTRLPSIIILNALAAVAIALAWLAGASTANDPMGPAGRVMGVTTGIAILVYVFVLFRTSKPVNGARASS
ncbi:MAG TPA: hypothetical protein VHZ81_07410 [Galbitalea sp.]|jgi:hypothetical protein|nr:hypothetical protein [Galbitalea sp.]